MLGTRTLFVPPSDWAESFGFCFLTVSNSYQEFIKKAKNSLILDGQIPENDTFGCVCYNFVAVSAQKVLLLNASNMESFPVYPSAFIQVPAVARQAGIEVICQDLLGIPEEQWSQTVQSLITQHDPVMILVTLRNTDSLSSQDYERDEVKNCSPKAYFPIERARALIALIRTVTDLKIAVGGFGFSLLSAEVMPYLQPDYGVFGSPRAFFDHFEQIKAGNPAGVPNLMYFRSDQLVVNPPLFYPPLAETEYTPHAVQAMLQFYEAFPEPGFLGAPVEIMRGCCHSCVFCAEPHVGGRQVQYRDLSAVMGDIEILVSHGITRIYIISSELNPEGNDFILQLADRIRSFNEQQSLDRRITWFGANYLLNFSFDEFERLHQSGFTGGWFDITALDDENARLMRTPYRIKSLISALKSYARFEKMRLSKRQSASPPEGVYEAGNADPEDLSVYWTLFLGNSATTVETIRRTLRVANEEGLAQLFSGCSITPNIRVFDYEQPDHDTLAGTFSLTPDLERTAYQQHLPSFAYSPALLQHFGSEEAIKVMFKHIAETYLSTKYQHSRNWLRFIRQKTDPGSVVKWTGYLSGANQIQQFLELDPASGEEDSPVIRRLFNDRPQDDEKKSMAELAENLVDSLLSACLEGFPDLFNSIGLPSTLDELKQRTPYELAAAIFPRWHTEEEIINEAVRQVGSAPGELLQDFLRFCIQAVLYRGNIQLQPVYRQLFIPDQSSGD